MILKRTFLFRRGVYFECSLPFFIEFLLEVRLTVETGIFRSSHFLFSPAKRCHNLFVLVN